MMNTPRPPPVRPQPLTLLGGALLVLWAAWWIVSLADNHFALAQYTWVPAHTYLGYDFQHNYLAVNCWLDGGNPYRDDIGDVRGRFGYPPAVLPLYAWCWDALLSFRAAAALWTCAIAAIMIAGVLAAQRCRRQLGLHPLSTTWLMALVLLSFPVLFAMERGNGDALILLLILVAAACLRRGKGWALQSAAGACLAVAVWIKLYPLLVLAALMALRRFKALAAAVVLVILIGVVPFDATRDWLATGSSTQMARSIVLQETVRWIRDPGNIRFAPKTDDAGAIAHSLGAFWTEATLFLGILPLHHFPGLIAAAILLSIVAFFACRSLLRAPHRDDLTLPALLLLATMATFLMPFSYDYNLIYLPLLLTCVWDRRDPRWVTILLIAAIPGLCPLRVVDVPAGVMFLSKLAALAAAMVCLRRRATA